MIHLGVSVVLEVQLLQRELTAGEDDGPPHLDVPLVIGRRRFQPVRVVLGRLRLERVAAVHGMVIHRIVDHHELALDLHRVRNEDVSAEQAGDGLRDHRLAVARRPVEEQGLGGVDGGPEHVVNRLREDHSSEALAHLLHRDVHVSDGLLVYPGAVLRQRHRRRADVLTRGQCLPGTFAAGAGEVEHVSAPAEPRGTAHLDHPALLEVEQPRIHEGERQAYRP